MSSSPPGPPPHTNIVTKAEYDYLSDMCYRRVLSRGTIHPGEAPPRYGFDVLYTIYQQQYQKYIRKNAHKFRTDATWERLLGLYLGGERISAIATQSDVNFSAYLLARVFVERLCRVPRSAVGRLVKTPSLIPDARLRSELLECCEVDTQCSPAQDRVRAAIGVEHEVMLQRTLAARGITFDTEGDLRARGYVRTPDVLLHRPIVVRCPHTGCTLSDRSGEVQAAHTHTVCWVDSKATLAEPHAHGESWAQLADYAALFGPGLVVYWYGFVDVLSHCHNAGPVTVCPPTPSTPHVPVHDVDRVLPPSSPSAWPHTDPRVLVCTHVPRVWRAACAEEEEAVRGCLPPRRVREARGGGVAQDTGAGPMRVSGPLGLGVGGAMMEGFTTSPPGVVQEGRVHSPGTPVMERAAGVRKTGVKRRLDEVHGGGATPHHPTPTPPTPPQVSHPTTGGWPTGIRLDSLTLTLNSSHTSAGGGAGTPGAPSPSASEVHGAMVQEAEALARAIARAVPHSFSVGLGACLPRARGGGAHRHASP